MNENATTTTTKPETDGERKFREDVERNAARLGIDVSDVDMPETWYTFTAPAGDLVTFIRIEHDDSPENPMEWDGSALRSLNTRHVNSISPEDMRDVLETDPDAVSLSYFEHGACIWTPCGELPPGANCPWDSVGVAGVLIPGDDMRTNWDGLTGDARRAAVLEWARGTCETYTNWANGYVYGLVLEVYAAMGPGEPYNEHEDYRRAEPVHEESCYGYYGLDDVTGYALREFVSNVPDDVLTMTEPAPEPDPIQGGPYAMEPGPGRVRFETLKPGNLFTTANGHTYQKTKDVPSSKTGPCSTCGRSEWNGYNGSVYVHFCQGTYVEPWRIPHAVPCPVCDGNGNTDGTKYKPGHARPGITCSTCNGAGEISGIDDERGTI